MCHVKFHFYLMYKNIQPWNNWVTRYIVFPKIITSNMCVLCDFSQSVDFQYSTPETRFSEHGCHLSEPFCSLNCVYIFTKSSLDNMKYDEGSWSLFIYKSSISLNRVSRESFLYSCMLSYIKSYSTVHSCKYMILILRFSI